MNLMIPRAALCTALLTASSAFATIVYQETTESHTVGTSFSHNVTVTGDVGTAKTELAASHAIQVVTAPSPVAGRPGTKAMKFELRTSDPQIYSGHRAELKLPNHELNKTYWYSWSVFIPTTDQLYQVSDSTDSEAARESPVINGQWHDATLTNSPPIDLTRKKYTRTGEEKWRLILRTGGMQSVDFANVQKGVWTDFVFQIRWSTGSDGFVKVWMNGNPTPVVSQNGATYPAGVTPGAYFKWGTYKWPWKQSNHNSATRTNQVVYFDEVKVGRDDSGSTESLSTMWPRGDGSSVPAVPNAAPVTANSDTFVFGGAATTNYGTGSLIGAKEDGTTAVTYDRIAYLKFDLSSLATSPTTATLILAGDTTTEAGTVTANQLTTDSWTETGTTWANKPAHGASIGSTTVAAGSTADVWVDVTSYIQDQYTNDSTKIASIALTGTNAKLWFKSRESGASVVPTLVFTGGGGTAPIIAETFSSANSNWTAVMGGTWTVTGGQLELTSPGNAIPNGNLYINNTTLTGNFELRVNGRATDSSTSAWEDFSVVFNYINPSNYYFASFNVSNDTATNGLFRVVNGVVTELADFSTTITSNTFYPITVRRVGSQLTVLRGTTTVATLSVSGQPTGLVKFGVGSRNDPCSFDDFYVNAL